MKLMIFILAIALSNNIFTHASFVTNPLEEAISYYNTECDQNFDDSDRSIDKLKGAYEGNHDYRESIIFVDGGSIDYIYTLERDRSVSFFDVKFISCGG